MEDILQDGEEVLYRVRYSDGDLQDFTLEDLLEYRARPQVAEGGASRTVDEYFAGQPLAGTSSSQVRVPTGHSQVQVPGPPSHPQ